MFLKGEEILREARKKIYEIMEIVQKGGGGQWRSDFFVKTQRNSTQLQATLKQQA